MKQPTLSEINLALNLLEIRIRQASNGNKSINVKDVRETMVKLIKVQNEIVECYSNYRYKKCLNA